MGSTVRVVTAPKPVAIAIPRDLPVEQLGGATVYRHGWMINCRCSPRASDVEPLCQLTARRTLPLRVIRVGFSRSALASAIHDTGHSHIRLGQVCLSPSCARIANHW